jgi:hypothetical protein
MKDLTYKESIEFFKTLLYKEAKKLKRSAYSESDIISYLHDITNNLIKANLIAGTTNQLNYINKITDKLFM